MCNVWQSEKPLRAESPFIFQFQNVIRLLRPFQFFPAYLSIRVPQFEDQEGEGCSLPLEIHIYTFVVHIYLQSDVSLCPQPLISWVVTHRGATKTLNCCFMTSVNGAGGGGGGYRRGDTHASHGC